MMQLQRMMIRRRLFCHRRSFSNDRFGGDGSSVDTDDVGTTWMASSAVSSISFSPSISTTTTKSPRPDPTVKRPNRLCDPYGQGGKPLQDMESLQSTIHVEWKVEYREEEEDTHTHTHTQPIPLAIVREFSHPDFLTGARFLQRMAAVAQLHAHYPSLVLDRRPMTGPPRQKYWQVITTIRCSTKVLGGLSTHDFHLAMLIDVEAEREDIQSLLIK
jgi:pterin-4a-carbinolamine dehydratase